MPFPLPRRISQHYKFKVWKLFQLNKSGIFVTTTLPRLSMNADGITDTLTVPLRISTIPLRLCYTLSHAHKQPRFTKKVLNSLKLPWQLPDYRGSSGIFTDHYICIYSAAMTYDGVLPFVKPW